MDEDAVSERGNEHVAAGRPCAARRIDPDRVQAPCRWRAPSPPPSSPARPRQHRPLYARRESPVVRQPNPGEERVPCGSAACDHEPADGPLQQEPQIAPAHHRVGVSRGRRMNGEQRIRHAWVLPLERRPIIVEQDARRADDPHVVPRRPHTLSKRHIGGRNRQRRDALEAAVVKRQTNAPVP